MNRSQLLLSVVALFVFAGRPQASHCQEVAITFDDLPLNGSLSKGVTEIDVVKETLKILKQRRAPQVFGFINAKKLEGNPSGAEALRLWVSGGQRVGNHTYSHTNLHTSDAEQFSRDVEQNEPALELLSPSKHSSNHSSNPASSQWRWLRYPFLREGNTVEKRRAVREYLQRRNYSIAQVTLDYEDYLWNTPYARCLDLKDAAAIKWLRSSYLQTASEYLDANREMATLVFGREIKHVLLLHLGAFSSAILPDLLEMLKAKGFRLVTLEDAQSDPVYQTDPDAGTQYGGTLLEQWMDVKSLSYPKLNKKPQKELDALCR